MQTIFIQCFEGLNEDKKKLLMRTLDEFFQAVWEKETYNGVVKAMNFLNGHINGGNGDKVLGAYNTWKEIFKENIDFDKRTKVKAIGLDDDEKIQLSPKDDLEYIPEGVSYDESKSVPSFKEAGDEESQQAALNRGRDFVASIMKDVEEIPGSDGMRVLPQVVQLETDDRYDLVIRNVTQPFWEECIRVVSTPNKNFLLCAVGTPGIGKTSSTPFLIRMLLRGKRTVVYRIASSDYFWEFSWTKEQTYVVRVHPKETPLRALPSLIRPSTYYVVDPGSTGDSCVPDLAMKARTIIVSSPNERHWGGTEFEKLRGTATMGMFRYLPMWSLHEILKSKCYLSSSPPSDEELTERFQKVGGVPRHVFLPEEAFDRCIQSQNDAVRALTLPQAQWIVEETWDAVGSFGSNQPKSALIGYALLQGETRFSPRHVTFVSQLVAESIAERFIGDL